MLGSVTAGSSLRLSDIVVTGELDSRFGRGTRVPVTTVDPAGGGEA
jgi:hypothetical protein